LEWFDPYEIRARLVPALVVSLPGIVTLFFVVLSISESLAQFLSSGVVLVILVYTASFLVRYLGRTIESKIWQRWDGPPSTRFLRWRDPHFGDEVKRSLHEGVKRLCEIELSTAEDESTDHEEADRRISQAFGQVKAVVRRDDPDGVWSKHNAEYGFHRNLLGSRVPWLLSAIAETLVCGTIWHLGRDEIMLVASAINSLLVVWSIIWGWYFLPRFAKEAADRYADSAWNSFLVSARNSH
jgi:hypothetical protein